MLYNVAQLLKAPVGSDLRQDFSGEIALADDAVQVVKPLTGHVRLQRTNMGVLATGEFAAVVQMQCVRCLDDFQQTLHVSFSELFVPVIDVVTGRPLPPTTDDEGFPIDARHHLDLTEMLRQQIILNLPDQPLCRADCAGLCAICGGNRNVRPCDCETQDDLRWQALTTLAVEELPQGD